MTRTWIPGVPDAELSALATTPRLVIALDFDGTASPLVDEPMSARALPAVAEQVARLTALPDTLVAYVSGRSMPDLRIIAEHTDDSPIALAGSHGAQYWFPGADEVAAPADPVDEATRADLWEQARAIIARHPGAEFEPKSFGFGVHTRRAEPEVESAVQAEIDALMAARLPSWRRRAGHRVLEFSSRMEGKDAAIGVLRERFAATGMLFAGDDVTDEDAMAALCDGDLGVRVGPGESRAALRVEDPQQIAELLAHVATERAVGRE